MNKLLSIHCEGKFHNWEGCGLCMHALDVGIQNKYMWRSSHKKRPSSIHDLNINIRTVILEEICKDLRKITSEELFSLVKFKRYKKRDSISNENFDPFYSDVGYFLWGMVIVFVDGLMQDRLKLHELLRESLAGSYLTRMEEHSGDYGIFDSREVN